MILDNLILRTDSYKFSHWKQYPPGTQYVRSYMEARGGNYKKVVTFGALQMIARHLFDGPVILKSDIDEAEDYVNKHMGPYIFNRKGWERILHKHGGCIPLHIRAVQEGHLVPVSNALITIENTDPELPWLTNYFETAFYPWYPYTVATLSYECKQTILKYLQDTGDPSLIDFKLHDFGYRGTTDSFSGMQAAVGGLAHLVNFKGTDTVAALEAARYYYGCDMAGFSIPAAEHSTITSWGRTNEVTAYDNMLKQFPTGLVAVVSDSYDIYAACDNLWGKLLREDVINRGGVLVIRPDSGFPPEVVHKCLDILGKRFGSNVNHKGFKVLHSKVRLIWGDGLDPMMIDQILANMTVNGWSADNITFGMGGGLLQNVNRDTMKFAMKASQVVVNGEEHDAYKDPITDHGKRSKTGNLNLYKDELENYFTLDKKESKLKGLTDAMVDVYKDGEVLLDDTLDQIRERMKQYDAQA